MPSDPPLLELVERRLELVGQGLPHHPEHEAHLLLARVGGERFHVDRGHHVQEIAERVPAFVEHHVLEPVAGGEVDVVLVGLGVDPGLEGHAVHVVRVPPVPRDLAGPDPGGVGQLRGPGQEIDERARQEVAVLFRDAEDPPGIGALALGHRDVVRGLHDLEVPVACELLLQRIRREGGREPLAALPHEPEARVVLHVRFGDRDLDSLGRLDHRGEAGQRVGCDVLDRQAHEGALVVGEEALFLRIVGRVVAREGERSLLARDLHLGSRQRGLEAIGDALVVGPEHDRVAPLQLEAKLVVVLADLRRLLTHGRLEHPVDPRGLRGLELRPYSEHGAVDRHRKRRVHKERLPAEEHAVANALAEVDAHLEASVRRAQGVALRGRERDRR